MREIAYLIALLFLGIVTAQQRYRLCAPNSISENTCIALQRGESQVSCLRVEDSAECAIRLSRGEADFGVFTAEEALLAWNFYPQDSQVIAQLKHRERVNETFEFQTVAVVPSNYTPGSFNDLKQGGFCHPGFSKSQLWNDNILKRFERQVYNKTCNSTLTAAENEALNLKNYFGKACRPGNWVADSSLDAELKLKYPELCSACDNSTSCQYARTENHGHTGALDCLTSGKGNVAYVSLAYLYQYFGINSTIVNSDVNPDSLDPIITRYRFLCSDGVLEPLYSSNPCSWLRQPWTTIVARNSIGSVVQERLKVWLQATDSASQDWTVALNSILQQSAVIEYLPEIQSLGVFLSRGRQLTATAQTCGSTIRWCTVNTLENNKCNWVAKAAITHGIEPAISCVQGNSTFNCLRNITNDNADILTIDSNYGYLARRIFNLSTVMYTETELDRNSIVIAVVRENSTYNVSSFATIKSRAACFPEYGGIAWLSFVKAARQNKIISDSCNVIQEVGNLVSSACIPGFADRNHQNITTASTASTLCSLCPVEANGASCSANSSNIYYGDKGALECLNSGAGDVAFLEPKNLNDLITSQVIDPAKYRVLCRNGSLAGYTGFSVDEQCTLSVTIDSEVMGRNSISSLNKTDTISALLKIEDWLGYRTNSLRPIHVYGPFNGTKNLLFKDSTVGLETTNSTLKAVLSYKELFAHYESCIGSGSVGLISSLGTVLLLALVHYL